MNILVVDDEVLIAKGICYMIQKMELNCGVVDFAISGTQALEKLRNINFDLCLTDISMPDMDGLELIDSCKKAHLCKSFCIISGYADFNYARQAIRLSVQEYLLKPIDKDMLLEMLQRFDLSIKLRSGLKACNNSYIAGMLQIMESEYRSDISLSQIAGRVNLNPDYAGKLFKTCVGFGFSEYLHRYRLDKILQMINNAPDKNFEELAAENGFTDIRNFYRVFKKIFNMTPGEYREKHLGE